MSRRKGKTRRPTGQGSYWTDGKRHYFRYKGQTVADREKDRAEAKFEALKRQINGDIDREGGRQQLRDYLPRYIDAELNIKETTAHNYHKRADYYIIGTLGDYRLCDMTYRVGRAWLDAMLTEPNERGQLWALSSVRQAVRLLQRALDAAVVSGLLEENKLAGLKVPTRRKGDEHQIDDDEQQAKTFTAEQVDVLLAEVKRTDKHWTPTSGGEGRSDGMYVLYVLAVRLGLRRGELCGLRWKDIDFTQKIIHIRQQFVRMDNVIAKTTPKTPTSKRDVPMTDEITTLLRAHKLKLGERGREYVFPGKTGDRRRPDGVTQHFARACDRLGLVGFVFHSLRKTAVTNWRNSGADLEVAASLAGHKGIKVTADYYSDATMERKRKAIEGGS